VVRFTLTSSVLVVAACSGGARDAGPTGRREPAASGRTDGASAQPRAARPLDAALVDQLAAVTVTGSNVAVVRRSDAELASIVAAPDGTRVTITASACLGCTAIDLPAWEARRAELVALWAPVDTSDKLALAAASIAGHTVIAIDASRTVDGELRHTYQLHWNDGATQLAALCEVPACAAAATAAMAAYLDVLTR
jgi:hypothetical protein